MNPIGTIQVRPDKMVRVCSWCEGQTKQTTAFWEECGYEVTHGICTKHADELKAGLPSVKPSERNFDCSRLQDWLQRNQPAQERSPR